MKSKLFWLFYDDVFSCWIPPNHMVVFWTLEKPVQKVFRFSENGRRAGAKGSERSNEKTVLTRRVL